MPDPVKPKVLSPGMYAIDVEPIPPPQNRNNREVHLNYLKNLKESVETLREIVEEARAEKPLDSLLAYACLYAKHSQELLEYVIGTCSNDFNKRDRKIATAPLIRKKRVTFVEPLKGVTVASGSKPRSNIKKDRTLPAKSDPKTVENHPRNNKSSVKLNNRVDSSISSKRTFVKKLHVNKWKPAGRKFTLREQCPLTRFTKSKVVPVKQPENVSTSNIVITERFRNTSQKSLTRTLTEIVDPTYQTLHIRLFSNAGRTDHSQYLARINVYIRDLVALGVIILAIYEFRINYVLWIFGLYTSSLLNAACKKALNPLKKGLLIRGGGGDEKASKRRRSLLDHKIQQLSKGLSDGSSIIPEVPDEPKDNSGSCRKLQAGNVQTSLTLSSAKLKIQSMADVPIHQEDPTNIRVIPKYHSEDGNPARANIKQALGSYKDGDGVIEFRQRQVHYRMLILDQHIQ
ncbi:hypothetical protein Tco_1256612 [Tanacetum coccineum]